MAIGQPLELGGRRFGRWQVLSKVPAAGPGARYWKCRCDCGHESEVRASVLSRGKSTSCGCDASVTHGKSKTHLYTLWMAMKNRCYDSNIRDFHNYGGRGIQVCARWKHNFEAFLADMGERPSPDHSLDRIDNNGDYGPDNCRWATWKEQCRNRRTNKLLTIAGETKVLTDWIDQFGMHISTYRYRIRVMGMTEVEALTTPSLRPRS
jgi:hypothetical protein